MQMDLKWLTDPEMFGVNRREAHSSHEYFRDVKEAEENKSSFKESLNGTWKMFYSKNLSCLPAGFEKPDTDVSYFDDVTVPLPIQMQGYGEPVYVNVQYPWDGHESLKSGQVPVKSNPTASYVKDFVVPKAMRDERIYVSFEGVEAAFAVYMNGNFVGYSEDSFTTHEFDVTEDLNVDGVNRLAVQVYKYCTSSWLEDQDFFRFSGIFRNVNLVSVPEVHIEDMFIKALPVDDYMNGVLDMEIKVVGAENADIILSVEGPCISEDGIEIKGKLNKNGIIKKKVKFDFVELWSAEKPNLYTLTFTVKDESGKVCEVVTSRAGFREFKLEDGLLKINGKRIVFNGVNRHEMSCDTGRTVSYEDTLLDIINMKRHNINAIRTCHYPDQTFLYDLADEYGLYIIDECNLETHGTWSKPDCDPKYILPKDNPKWTKVVLDRVKSVQERDKNHPAIVFWSCGNESFGGKNIFLMSEAFRNRDNTRLVHYEGICHDRSYNATSDVESQMYPKPWDIERFLKEHPEKPFICCEYMHAMGNSLGNMDEYTELSHTNPRYQGGFIWDYIDQAFIKKDRYGVETIMYGGDFDDRPNDYNFCGDGIVFADRSNSPKMQDVKFLYQNIKVDVNEGEATITNYNLFTDTNEYECVVTYSVNGEVVKMESLEVDCAPGDTVKLPLRKVGKKTDEVNVNVAFLLTEDTLWGEEGYEIAFGEKQFNPSVTLVGLNMMKSYLDPQMNKPEVIDCDFNYAVEGAGFKYIFAKEQKGFISMKVNGKEMLSIPPKPNFWRAPVDNDMGSRMPLYSGQWKLASMYNGVVKSNLTKKKTTPVTAEMNYMFAGFAKDNFVKVSYEVQDNGIIKVSMDYAGIEGAPCMPEFGMMFTIPADYEYVQYLGNGPEECYSDRSRGAKYSQYEFLASENVTPYLMPQECGNRTGVRFMAVTDSNGHGLMIAGDSIEVNVLPYTPHEMENAKHYYELPDVHYTIVRVNLKQMGVGGDDSWGAPVHEQYRIPGDKPLHFEFYIAGI